MTDIHLRGLTRENVAAAIQITVRAAQPQIERLIDADDPDERQQAVNALLTATLVEGIRFTWSEVIAQLIEAGVTVTGGAIDIDSVPPSQEGTT